MTRAHAPLLHLPTAERAQRTVGLWAQDGSFALNIFVALVHSARRRSLYSLRYACLPGCVSSSFFLPVPTYLLSTGRDSGRCPSRNVLLFVNCGTTPPARTYMSLTAFIAMPPGQRVNNGERAAPRCRAARAHCAKCALAGHLHTRIPPVPRVIRTLNEGTIPVAPHSTMSLCNPACCGGILFSLSHDDIYSALFLS